MKKIIKSVIMFLTVLTGTSLFTSCENDDVVVNMPAASFVLDSQLFVSNGETLEIKGLSLDKNLSSEGVYIKKVEYYFDDEKFFTSTSQSFASNYLIQNKSLGDHELKIKAIIAGDGFTDTEFTVRYTVKVLEKPFVLHFTIKYDNTEHVYGNVRNGDILSGTVSLAEITSIDATITKIECYWDEKMFGATSISPFQFKFNVENENVGTHILKIIVYTSSSQAGELKSTLSMQYNVIQ